MYNSNRYFKLVLGCMLFWACSSQDEILAPVDDADNIIHVGSVTTSDMMPLGATTRGVLDDNDFKWLRDGLTNGLDITYKKDSETTNAKLKLSGASFTMIDNKTNKSAKWLGNGAHIFQGVYVPENLMTAETTHSYEDLSHYTAIPPSHKINATLEQIKIPLQHRLARVVAYVLIENSLGPDVWLKGYDKDNEEKNKDVTGTMLRFCNVWTLANVTNGKPLWELKRKVIPHYLGIMENVRVYKNSDGKLIFPTDEVAWDKAKAASYPFTDYAHVPYYDIIVRPTYTKDANNSYVMYDEDLQKLVENNQIDFELTLSNDLEYEKHFEFNLNANDETEVYLRVTPERIDYSSAGARQWKRAEYHDKYYGVDHTGYDLSKAGSSWQRAYTYTSGQLNSDEVSDGTPYNNTQYVNKETFIALMNKAYKDGDCDGKYFILTDDITIDVSDFADNFEFTGHLDGLDHTITLTNTKNINRTYLFFGKGDKAEVLNVTINNGNLFEHEN